MKKFLLTIMVMILVLTPSFAGGQQEDVSGTADETNESMDTPVEDSLVELEPLTIRIGVLKGPSGFGIIKMMEETKTLSDNVTVEYEVMPSPTEMIARMSNGEIQGALLPLNVAAKLYTKGAGYPLAAIPGLGSIYILSTDDSINTWEDLKGKTVHAVGKGATPDYLFQYYLKEKGIDPSEVNLDFSIPAAQMAQMAVAGKVETMLVPQPFAALSQMKVEGMEVRLSFQDAWTELQNTDEVYPITAFVVDPDLASDRTAAYNELLAAYENSISWVLAHPAEAAALIEKYGILAAGPAQMAIPDCGLNFATAMKAKASVEAYLQVLLESDPVSVGGTLPGEGFFLAP